jgi:hypothetical protein
MTKAELKSQFQNSYKRESWMPILKLVFGQINFFSNPFPLFEGEEAVKQGCQIGYVDLPNNQTVAIFEIEVTDRIIIERNRKGLRDIAAKYIKGTFSAALVFYYSKNQNEYRFSFIAQQSKIDEQTGEFNTVVTAPKRYTYVLGTPFCTTAASRWIDLSAEPEINVDKITVAFSVEKLSKEFFDQYKIQYTRFCKFIADDSVTLQQFIDHTETDAVKAQKPLRDYVKKLLGRLVFLQFLQKKGWMGVPATNKDWKGGDLNFMANLFDKSPYKDNFLDQVLEPLFFRTLNAERANDIAVDIDTTIKIPYLNGGLFEKTTLDDTNVQFPKHYFSELFEFFNQYNFTIDENDPDDAEVGIDPEMLGHIFENLLEDNKDKGAFYTPKEIVRYMCQESLIAYLQTHTPEALHTAVEKLIRTHKVDECLQDKPNATLIQKLLIAVKICDPAIGSGAFPMGMLYEIFMVRRYLFSYLGKNDSFSACLVKKEIIQNNIYGVDIEQGAVDIARLRFWLALVVDEDVPQALPNLDYKIIQGNSLVESFQGHDLSKIIKTKNSSTGTSKSKVAKNLFGEIENPQLTMGFDAAHTEANLNLLIREYFQINNSEDKHKKADIINDQIKEHIKNCAGHTPEVIEKVNAIDFNNKPFFLWHLYFADIFENGGFDVVIGNPPYIKEYTDRKAFDGVRSSKYYQGKMDLWYLFACFGIDLLKTNGQLCFIATNNWVTNSGASKMRNKVISDSKIIQLIDFGAYMIFDSASIQTMIMLFQKNKLSDNYNFDFRKLTKPKAKKEDAIALLAKNQNDAEYLTPTITRKDFLSTLLTFNNQVNEIILRKINSRVSYFTKDEVAQGIVFPQDFLNKKNQAILDDFNVGDGIFGLSDNEKNNLDLSSDELELIKPYFTTEQVKKYYTLPCNQLWLIYTDSSFKAPNSMDSLPNLKNHLDRFSDVITSDNKPYGLHRAREERFFRNEKIIVQRKCAGRPSFSYSDFDTYVSATFYLIQSDRFDMKFLLGLLNSKLIEFWLKNKGKMQGDNFQLDKEPLLEIPIKNTNKSIQKSIIELVNEIILSKEIDIEAKTDSLEQQIDLLVYKLYELSYEEVLLIEPDFGKRVSVEEYEALKIE